MSSVLYQIDGRDAKLRILIRYIGLSSSVLTSCISTVALVCEVLLNPALALLVFDIHVFQRKQRKTINRISTRIKLWRVKKKKKKKEGMGFYRRGT
jgi:hypothetical protein